jgi:hypothetical protein
MARDFIGLSAEALETPVPNPVPETHRPQTIDIMRDLYGSPDNLIPSRVVDSREIKKLVFVYANPEALEQFRAGLPLDDAYRKSEGEVTELIGLVREASARLDNANRIAPHHRKCPDAKRWAQRCVEAATILNKTLED